MGDYNYHSFYSGADYGLDPDYSNSEGESFGTSAQIGLTTDGRTANQIKSISEKLNTGAKTVEISLISPQIMESIPKEHFKEINRLRKLVGAELTIHGPLVEPTGWTEHGWDESKKEQSERQIWNAVEQGHEVDPKGNVVITFHSSAALPPPETRVFNEKTGKEEIKDIIAIDETDGRLTRIQVKENMLTGEKFDPKTALEYQNKEVWDKTLSQVSFQAHQGKEAVMRSLYFKDINSIGDIPDEDKKKTEKLSTADLYKKSKTPEGNKFIQSLSPETRRFVEQKFDELNYGHIYVRQAYNELQELFGQAWKSAERNKNEEDLKKLKAFRAEVAPILKKVRDDPAKVGELAAEVAKGVNLLNSIKTPQLFSPFSNFAIDKAADTFANVAVKSYREFEAKDNGKSPIISIENPPVGMGLARADELNKLIDKAKEKFKEKAMRELNLSEKDAKAHAEKVIGATWDVGHINMLRKFGYPTREIIGETEKIAGRVKHIHLSDNFGLEHTELPMGAGNVPVKEMLRKISEKNKDAKKIIEAIDWYKNFQTTPLGETFAHFNTPIYAMKNAPYWHEQMETMGTYFSGFGMNPDVHHAYYGAGFTDLPVELGGQQASNKSRVSGAPMD